MLRQEIPGDIVVAIAEGSNSKSTIESLTVLCSARIVMVPAVRDSEASLILDPSCSRKAVGQLPRPGNGKAARSALSGLVGFGVGRGRIACIRGLHRGKKWVGA